MALTSSVEDVLDATGRRALLDVARDSIRGGLAGRRPDLNAEDFSAALRVPRATFVTLEIERALRGCIGTLEAHQPLALDAAENAYAAAFRDPRFPPLVHAEFERVELHISILNPAVPMRFVSEPDLLGQLRPGVDGLILSERGRRATFLPAVWESIEDPWEFLAHLKVKAGLPADYWSETIEVSRYTVTSVS